MTGTFFFVLCYVPCDLESDLVCADRNLQSELNVRIKILHNWEYQYWSFLHGCQLILRILLCTKAQFHNYIITSSGHLRHWLCMMKYVCGGCGESADISGAGDSNVWITRSTEINLSTPQTQQTHAFQNNTSALILRNPVCKLSFDYSKKTSWQTTCDKGPFLIVVLVVFMCYYLILALDCLSC